MTFRFRPVLTIFAAIGLSILLALGFWQLQRLEWKNDLIAAVEARVGAAPEPFAKVFAEWRAGRDREYSPVTLAGVFRHELEAHVYGTLEGVAGYYVFTPLRLESPAGVADFVYVNRGFVPQELKAPEHRADGQVEGPVAITGLFRAPQDEQGLAALVALKDDPSANFWHRRDPSLFAAHARLSAAPVYVDSFGKENPAAWPKGGTTRLDFSNRHLEYALTWFGLAGALAAVWFAYSTSKR